MLQVLNPEHESHRWRALLSRRSSEERLSISTLEESKMELSKHLEVAIEKTHYSDCRRDSISDNQFVYSWDLGSLIEIQILKLSHGHTETKWKTVASAFNKGPRWSTNWGIGTERLNKPPPKCTSQKRLCNPEIPQGMLERNSASFASLGMAAGDVEGGGFFTFCCLLSMRPLSLKAGLCLVLLEWQTHKV